MLNKITENILKHPGDPTYTHLKTTGETMNRHIMSKKGTVQFLQRVCSFRGVFRRLTNALWTKMGFRTKVGRSFPTTDCNFRPILVQIEDFTPMLVFNESRMKDLRTGAKCLEEVMHNQVQAIEDTERAARQEIINQKAAKNKARRSQVSQHCEKKSLF